MTEQEPIVAGPFKIECRKTLHSVPTTALRIHAAGRTLGYSCDTAFDPSLIDWLAPADRIIHETNLGIHTPYEKLAALPREPAKEDAPHPLYGRLRSGRPRHRAAPAGAVLRRVTHLHQPDA